MDNGLRKCIVNGKRAYFQGVFQFAQTIPPDMRVGGQPGGQIACPVGVVEMEDGHLKLTPIGTIRFLEEEAEHGCVR